MNTLFRAKSRADEHRHAAIAAKPPSVRQGPGQRRGIAPVAE